MKYTYAFKFVRERRRHVPESVPLLRAVEAVVPKLVQLIPVERVMSVLSEKLVIAKLPQSVDKLFDVGLLDLFQTLNLLGVEELTQFRHITIFC